ncbi:SGNH hydrolase-type esterase domain-containing protein [Xylariaceae sp. FL0255]|nr:SGNH hydrolase-type esterase domain-containing protein [Xylariaceae sp. FL0255]
MRNSTLIAAIVGTIVTYFSFKSGLVGSGPATPPIARPVSLDQKLGSSSNMTLRITSLGSSFAAGPNIPPVVDAAAARSGANYAHLLSDRIGATLTDLSVSGATLLNLLDQPQDRGGHRFPPQITAIPADTDVVLVLGGGNDMYYIGGLMEDTLSRAWGGSLVRFYSYLKGGNPHREAQILLQSDVDAVATRYAHVLDAIHRKLPAAKVFIIEYQAILGPDTRPGQGEEYISFNS